MFFLYVPADRRMCHPILQVHLSSIFFCIPTVHLKSELWMVHHCLHASHFYDNTAYATCSTYLWHDQQPGNKTQEDPSHSRWCKWLRLDGLPFFITAVQTTNSLQEQTLMYTFNHFLLGFCHKDILLKSDFQQNIRLEHVFREAHYYCSPLDWVF